MIDHPLAIIFALLLIEAVVLFLKQHHSGSIRQILEAFSEHNTSVILGLLARLIIKGTVSIDIEKSSFGLLTKWDFHG